MEQIKKYLHNQNIGLLILRLGIGLTMAFSHGLGKLPPGEQLVGGVAAMGFPIPVLFAWLAALSEFAGGILIAIGLGTRYAAAALGFTMAVAFFIVHGADPMQVKELALIYLLACLALVFTGAGSYSVDSKLCKKS